MKTSSELEALRLKVVQDFKRVTGTDITAELITKMAARLFDEQASAFINQRIAHLQLGDMLNFIEHVNDRPEEDSLVTRPSELPSARKQRGRPAKEASTGNPNKN
jgi:hypothetical protein